MQNYRESEYAVNKFSSGIVYKFVNGTVEITLADYLRENPENTERDFDTLKRLSDHIYYQQDRACSRQTRKNLSIHLLEGTESFLDDSMEDRYVEAEERSRLLKAAKTVFDSGKLTAVQKRRFCKYICQGLSARQIAASEGVSHVNVSKSINAVKDKIKKFFLEEG